MKLTRNQAINIFTGLGGLALGSLTEDVLEKTMDNLMALRKVADDFEALKKELFKRLYGDIEKMDETEKKKLTDFFGMLSKLEHAEDKAEMEQAIKTAYPEYYDLRVKEIKMLVSLLNKDVDVELAKVDEKIFVKGILMGNKGAKAHEVRGMYAPLFIAPEKAETDLSELDELLDD